jgi:hypothetical protein
MIDKMRAAGITPNAPTKALGGGAGRGEVQGGGLLSI